MGSAAVPISARTSFCARVRPCALAAWLASWQPIQSLKATLARWDWSNWQLLVLYCRVLYRVARGLAMPPSRSPTSGCETANGGVNTYLTTDLLTALPRFSLLLEWRKGSAIN